MKKVIYIYNPRSGNQSIAKKTNDVIKKFNSKDICVIPYMIGSSENDISIDIIRSENPDAVIAAGGDGTISRLALNLKKENIDLPIGIIPAGTCNDLSRVLFIQMYRYAAEPFFLANFKKEDFLRANAEALKYFAIVSVAIFLLIMLFADAFALFVGPAFRQGMFILPLILLANIFSGMTLNLNFWYKQTGDTRFAIWITGTGLVVTVGLNVWLVPALGYVGAAWGRLGCETVMLALSFWLNSRYYPTPYNVRRIGAYFLLGGAIYGISYFTGMLPAAAKYLLNLGLLTAFAAVAVRWEHIDVRSLARSVLKRR